jgi:uncharacterized protein YndB with AHSA1/START domain
MATITQQVWINAPVSRVYSALATAEGLGGWWAPHTSTETDEGLVLAHSPGPAHGDVKMLVVDATPDKRVEWKIISDHPAESPASAWTGTRIVFEIGERPSPGPWRGMADEGQPRAVIEFRHSGWDAESDFFGFCNYAWGVTLDMLRRHCEA